MFIRSPITIAVSVAAAAAALAACSSSSGGGAAPPSSPVSIRTVTDTPSATDGGSPPIRTSPPPSSGSSRAPGGGGTQPSSTSSGGAHVAACAESQLRASIDPRHVPGSSTSKDYAIIVDFKNTSGTTCTLYGYPGAALEDSSDNQVKQATRTIRGQLLGLPPSQHSLPTATLAPGAYASAGLEGVNQRERGAAQAGCDATYPRILVTPPNTRTPVPFEVHWPVCFSFEVHPTNIEKNPPTS